jgi:hypothetical protein
MGGTPMLAGMFFVVAAIETLGGVPCTMTDVNMLNTCKIPQGLEERITLSTQLEVGRQRYPAEERALLFTFSLSSLCIYVCRKWRRPPIVPITSQYPQRPLATSQVRELKKMLTFT